MIDLVESKAELLARIDAYEKNESVRRLIDLAHLRRQVEGFPSPERVRREMHEGDNPTAAMTITAAQRTTGGGLSRTARQ